MNVRALVALSLIACSSSSAAPAPVDGSAPDAAPRDAGHESGTGFPIDDSGPPPDAGSACDQLRARVTALQSAARACNPQGPNECTANVDGICCPVTVSLANNGPVNDFTQALIAYKEKCSPDCTGVLCGGGPSNVCDGAGNKGFCQ